MLEGFIAGKAAKKMFKEKEIFKIVKRHAFWGCLLMALPDFGFGTIFFIAVLWHMYSSIAEKYDLSFSENFWSLAGLGFFVNIAIGFVIDLVMSPVFFLQPFVSYGQFYLSGKMYVETLKKLFGNSETTTNTSHPTHKACTAENKMTVESNTLLQLKELLDAGVLSQEEFEAEKKKILNN